MEAPIHACAKAADNLTSNLYLDRRFPRNVFGPAWCEFFFFDSDWMFDPAFVGYVKALLEVEGASCACMTNIDAAGGNERRDSRFIIDRTTTPEAYRSLLAGKGPTVGWINDIERFGCTSEVSEWCMYCERASEIAVIAVRRGVSPERYLPVLAPFKAARLADAVKQPLAYGFSSQALSEAWRSELLIEYASRPR